LTKNKKESCKTDQNLAMWYFFSLRAMFYLYKK
jgi:hypothetical protein